MADVGSVSGGGTAGGEIHFRATVDAAQVYAELNKMSVALENMSRQAGMAGAQVGQAVATSAQQLGATISNSIATGMESGARIGGQKVQSSFAAILSPKNLMETAAKFSVYYLYYQTFGALTSAMADIASYVDMLQRASVALEFYVGKGSEEFLRAMEDFAIRTPMLTSDIMDLTIQMHAFGFATEEILDYLQIFGDAAAAVTGGGARMGMVLDRIAWAMAQIKQSAVLNAQDMRQLAQAGIPAWEYLAEFLGTDVAGAMDAVKERTVSSTDAIRALSQGMEEDFGGAMERTMQTVSGQWAVFTDLLRAELGASLEPVVDFIAQEILAPLNESLEKARELRTSPEAIAREEAGGRYEQYAEQIGGQALGQAIMDYMRAQGLMPKEDVNFQRAYLEQRDKLTADQIDAAVKAYLEGLKRSSDEIRAKLEDIRRDALAAQAKEEEDGWLRGIFSGLSQSLKNMAQKREYERLSKNLELLSRQIENLTGVISLRDYEEAMGKYESYTKTLGNALRYAPWNIYSKKDEQETLKKAVDYATESLDIDKFGNMIDEYSEAIRDIREEKISLGMSVLKETPVTQADLWVSQLQDIGMAGWDYVEKWDEQARRMKSVINEGLLSQWVGMVPAGIQAQGEMATRAWASKWVEEFYLGLHPEEIDVPAAAAELRRQWEGEQQLKQIAIQVAEMAGIPYGEVLADFEKRFGVTLTDDLEQALRSKDPARVMALVMEEQVEEHADEIEEAGATWFTTFFEGIHKVDNGRLYDLFVSKVIDALGMDKANTGERSAYQGKGGYAQ